MGSTGSNKSNLTELSPKKTAARGGAVEKRADADLVDKTLRLLHKEDASLTAAKRRVGAHVLDAYFGGDVALARSRNPAKPKSYALLAERASLDSDWDARDLYEAVVIEMSARSLPTPVRKKLASSHLLRLWAVDDPAVRSDLARKIAQGELVGEAARNAIAKAAAKERHGGRPGKPAAVRAIGALERAVLRSDGDGAFAARELDALDDASRRDLAKRLRAVADHLRKLAQRVSG